MKVGCLAALVLAFCCLVPAADGGRRGGERARAAALAAPRLLYASDWSGVHRVYALDPSGRAATGQLTFGRGSAFDPVASPNGRSIAYLEGRFSDARTFGTGALWVARANGGAARRLVLDGASAPAWSPDSSRIAYYRSGHWHVARADGSRDRVVQAIPGWANPGVSADGRWTATRTRTTLVLSSRSPRRSYTFVIAPGDGHGASAWSPDSRYFAFADPTGISVVDVRAGRLRRLTAAVGFALRWRPDSRALAFVRGRGQLPDFGFDSGELELVTLAGRVTRIVDDDRAYGGRIVDLAWTRPPAGLRYRAPEPASSTRVDRSGLLVGGEIERLAADGTRVALAACGGVYAWTPGGEATPLGEAGALAGCPSRRHVVHSLAVAGDRVAYGTRSGCNVITIALSLEALAPVRRSSQLARAFASCGAPNRPGFHRLTGAGGLLVFSTLHERQPEPGSPCCRTELEEVNRIEDGGCPCPVISSSPGPLAPADVDHERLVVFGDNETLVLDRAGRTLVAVPVSPLAAQLSGPELVLLRRGALRVHDAATGALVRAWPLPDVPSGGTCDLQCVRGGDDARLRLQDVARGLAAYVLDGDVHLLRLADGRDVVLGPGTLARFLDTGLVYAHGARLRLVPFARLPLS